MRDRLRTPNYEWNVPDWRKPDQYPVPLSEDDDEDKDQWRWEFLRRDKDYRRDWKRFLDLDHPFKLSLRDDPQEPHFDLPKYPEEFPDRHGHIFHVLSKYKLARLLNPSTLRPRYLYFYPVPNRGVMIWFDLDGSLREELEYARKLLDRHQRALRKKLRRNRRPPKREWPKLLRIIDAYQDGQHYDTIGYKVMGLDPNKYGSEEASSKAESKLETARSLWKNMSFELFLPPIGLDLAQESHLDDIVPPGYPRIILPRLA